MTLQLQFRLFCSKLSFRTLCDFDLNEAIDANMILSHTFSIVVFIKEDSDHPQGAQHYGRLWEVVVVYGKNHENKLKLN